MSLSIPKALAELDLSPEPSTLVTRANDYLATWNLGTLAADSYGEGISASGLIVAAGQITATATITHTSSEADPTDNVAQASDFNAEILMPVIEGPSTAIVGQRPVFFGLGQPNATISLYLSGTLAAPGRLLGSSVVDDYGRWIITPSTPIATPGWYWFTATQRMGSRLSPATGAGNFVTDTLVLDTNSMTRNGERIGGINQPLGWGSGITYTLGARLTQCGPNAPLSPTLQVLLFNEDGLVTSYRDVPGTTAGPTNADVQFDFFTPDDGSSFELFARYFCMRGSMGAEERGSMGEEVRLLPSTLTPLPPGSHAPQGLKEWFGCWESLGCDKPNPPPPPPKPGCTGCTPVPRPRPRPKATDPDGFVYDCSMVRAGATMTQSIITSAWVTATQRTGTGANAFTPWNALEFDQVNPQYTDGKHPDKVTRPGYYSFIVPSGDYRVQAVAPGYVPYESPLLQVVSTPITHHIGMRRLGDVGVGAAPMPPRVFLPLVRR